MAEPAIHLQMRSVTPDDAEALAELMLDAYSGTVDDEGETIAEAREEVRGYFALPAVGPMLEYSLAAIDEGEIVSAALLSRSEGDPFFAYVMTAASHKGRGLATALITRSLRALLAAGELRAHLWVTVGNEPAEKIYERLGFTDVST